MTVTLLSKSGVGGRAAAARRRRVDHVVVHERGGVQQLDRGGERHQQLELCSRRACPRAAPGPGVRACRRPRARGRGCGRGTGSRGRASAAASRPGRCLRGPAVHLGIGQVVGATARRRLDADWIIAGVALVPRRMTYLRLAAGEAPGRLQRLRGATVMTSLSASPTLRARWPSWRYRKPRRLAQPRRALSTT